MNAQTPSGRSELLSRLRADLSERWHSGERPRIEEYLGVHPELADSPEHLLDLVHAEVRLREQTGETPTLGEYRARFPRYADAIERQWQLDRLIGRGGMVTLAPLPTGPDAVTEPQFLGPPEPTGPFPGLLLLEEVGRGGMGVVYKARQYDLDRVVAVKLVRTLLADSPAMMTRFRNEARAVGRIGHPGIVQVHGFGEHEGCLYLVMEYLAGGSLAQRLRAAPLPPREAAALVAKLARAVQAAHDANVLHRDLKPGNVLLSADGEPKVGDFGLAKLLDSDAIQTQDGALVGTPAYMAPEQADGVTAAPADVWSLGVILYECLTGRLPFQGSGREATLRRVCTARATPPRRLRPDVPGDLEMITLKCLRKAPADRYPSALALAEDLERHLQGQAVARPRPPRGRWLAAAAAALLVAGAAVLWQGLAEPADARWQRQALARLEKGEAVTLIGERDPPKWWRWAAGEQGAKMGQADDGAVLLDSSSFAILELLPGVPLDRYRLRAELRHEKSYEGGEVGIYVGHQQVWAGGREGHFLVQASYNDIHDAEAERATALKGLNVKPEPPARRNIVELIPKLYFGTGWAESGHLRVEGANAETFKAAGHKGGVWRALTIEVRPDAVTVLWGATGKEVVSLAPADIAKGSSGVLTRAFDRPHTVAWLPRGGAGILVNHGVVAVRRVVLEPIPD